MFLSIWLHENNIVNSENKTKKVFVRKHIFISAGQDQLPKLIQSGKLSKIKFLRDRRDSQ